MPCFFFRSRGSNFIICVNLIVCPGKCVTIYYIMYIYVVYILWHPIVQRFNLFQGRDLKKRRRSQSQQANALQSDDSHSLDVQAGEHL